MKNSLFKVIITILLTGGVLTLTACDFFLNGEELKKELDQQIAYTNAPSVSVYLKADAELGEFLSDGEKTFKVGYDTEVQFTVNQESYVFEKLEAVVRNSPETSRSGSVQFTEVESDAKKGIYKINVKVLEQVSDIMIRPVCTLLPKISSISPALETNGCNQDSAITIAFNKNMNPDSFKNSNGKITGLSITNGDDEDLSAYFDEPYFASDNKTLVILPQCYADNPKFLLPPDESKSSLYIKVNYTFVDVKDEDGLSFTANGTHNYKINKNFNKQEEVTVIVQNPDSSYGSFLSAGEKSCIVGFGFEVEFTLNTESYIFEGFEAVSKNDTSLSRADCVAYENEQYENGVYRAKVRVLKAASDILIRPKCTLIENAEVTITKSEKGTENISPADGTKVQSFINRWYSVSFSPDDDYEFIRWELYDIKTDSSITNGTYVKLDDPTQPSTSYKVTQVPDTGIELALRPIVTRRPQILSGTPANSNAGSLKDSTIQVIFNHDMDENSIYYTEAEVIALRKNGIKDSNFLPALAEDELPGNLKNHYGYKADDGEVHFKNIVIKDNRTDGNLLGYFSAPSFETSKILSIPVKNGKDFPSYTQIYVCIEKEFFFEEDSVQVTLSSYKDWVYWVTDETDTSAPVLIKYNGSDFSVSKDSSSSAWESTPSASFTLSDIPNFNFITNNKIYLKMALQDTGCGPSPTFTMTLTKKMNSSYEASDTSYTYNLSYTGVSGTIAYYSGEIDLDSFDGRDDESFEEGVYGATFEFTDQSGNKIENPSDSSAFYFAYDKTAPKNSDFAVTNGSSNNEYKLSWTNSDSDFSKSVVTITGATETTYDNITGTSQSINLEAGNNLEAGKSYKITVTSYDYAGNGSTYTYNRFLTGLSVSGTPTFSFLDGLFKTEETASSRGLSATAFYSDGTSKIVSGNAKVAYPQNIKKEAGFSYTEGDVTKIGLLAGEYYVAKNDVLHTNLSAGDTTGSSATFGNYPQSASSLSGEDAYTSEYIYKEWYLGKDGYFYAKNGDNYYKVEPVHWRVLESERVAPYKQKYLLLASSIMEGGIPYYVDRNERHISSETIETVNYYYSTVRAFLRGEYQSGDTQERTYEGKGFLQIAFTEAEREKISEITLLKENDFLNSKYGFNTNGQKQDENRAFAGTAWACSKGLKGWVSGVAHYTYWDNNHYAWTQPNSSNSALNILGPNGAFGREYYSSSSSYFSYYSEYIDETNIGILPAITVYGNAAY